jgi:ComF family protein
MAHAPCPYCKGRGLHPYRDVLRLGIFREPLRGMIHSLKYQRQWQLGELLAERLHEDTAVRELLEHADCIVPVPLHWRRHLMRGYNQSAVLAERLGRLAHRNVVRSAVRVRHTPTQTHLHSRARRHDNLRNAFALRAPAALEGKHVVVVDDVMTTGATLQSVGRVLKSARPSRLSAIVLAIADPRGQGFERI